MFAVGFAAAAVAGERQRGTLEVLLSRPLSRRGTYLTLRWRGACSSRSRSRLSRSGAFVGSAATGRAAELGAGNLPLLWLNGALLFWAFGAIALLASVSFDRLTPALGISLAVVLVSYFLDVLGSLWPDAKWLQPYSLFHYLDAKADLAGLPDTSDFVVLAAVIAVAVIAALVVFPRRDLAAPPESNATGGAPPPRPRGRTTTPGRRRRRCPTPASRRPRRPGPSASRAAAARRYREVALELPVADQSLEVVRLRA